MGDRTNVYLAAHPDDLDQPGWQEWLHNMGPTEYEDEIPGIWSGYEVNYAGWEDLEDLAASGVRFVGHHGPGGEYNAQEFFHDTGGTVLYEADSVWSRDNIVVTTVDDPTHVYGRNVTSGAIDEALQCLYRYRTLNEEITTRIKELTNGT